MKCELMHEYEINSNTWTSIQLVNAIKSNDADSVSKLLESALSPESASNVIRINSTNVVAINDESRAYKHSLLWVAPVIVKTGSENILPSSNGAIVPFGSKFLLPALKAMFSSAAEIRHLSGLVPHSAVTKMNPCEIYEACKVFSSSSKKAPLKFKADMAGAAPDLPRLCFAIGTASGFNSKPAVKASPSEETLKFGQLLESTLQFNIGEGAEHADNVQCLPPMELSEGLYQGVKRWLEAIRQTHVFHGVGLVLAKAENYRFQLFIQSGEEHPVICLEWDMKSTHVAEKRIAEIYQWLDSECSMPLSMKMQREKMMH
jgi:hypothetical protein